MLRKASSYSLSVSTQLSIIVGALVILLFLQTSFTRRFADMVTAGAQSFDRQIVADASNLWALSLLVAVVSVCLLCPLAVVVVRRFAVRLDDITSKMLRISRNDTDVRVAHFGDEDELGDLARALQVFQANCASMLVQQDVIERLNYRFEAALNNMARGLTMFDAKNNLVVCNEQFRKMYDVPLDQCHPGISLKELLFVRASRVNLPADVRGKYVGKWLERHNEVMKKRTRADLVFQVDNGRTISVTYEPMSDGGCVAVHEDITEKRHREEKINRLARSDSLTGVSNRFSFNEMLDRQLELCPDGQGFAVHLIDLDRFKEVNDTLGHAVGDVLLRLAAARISKSMRSVDFVARLGGDEFAVIQTGVGSTQDAMIVAHRLVKILSAPFQIQGQNILVGASIGVVADPCEFDCCDDVLKKADIALYRAKEEGRGVAVEFLEEFETALRSRRALEADVRRGIRENQFELYYQPIVSLNDCKVVSCEALMRWPNPLRGWVPPSEFIPIAEDLGLIGVLGEWALRTACMEASQWPDDVKVSVNLSPSQFQSLSLVEVVRSALEDAGLAPHRLDLEVTESLMLRDNAETTAIMRDLHALGVNFSLDDFGTGYASLSYLLAFPFDKIKVDRMFIKDINEREQSAVILRAILSLAQNLNIRAVAEGVETREQLSEVRRLGCQEVQGYLFSKPVPADEVVGLISQKFGDEVIAA